MDDGGGEAASWTDRAGAGIAVTRRVRFQFRAAAVSRRVGFGQGWGGGKQWWTGQRQCGMTKSGSCLEEKTKPPF